MKINNQKLLSIFLVAILITFIPLGAAAPPGTSESAVVEAAKNWLGVKSVSGGDGRSGIDCAHLVFEVYKQVGAKNIVFQTVPNMKKNPYYVTTTSPTPGDVIFWKKDVTKNNKTYWLAAHVGIYIGNGQFIDTSFDTKAVATESISGVYEDGMPYYAKWAPDGNNTPTEVTDVTTNNSDSNLPVASFSASPTTGKAPLRVTFTDKSSGTPTSWSWNFGDESTSAEKNPVHNYSVAGNYTVNMTVTNQNGIDSKTQEIIVQGEPGQEKVIPIADFSSDVASGYALLNVQFTDLSKNANSWNWDFGDGTNSAEQSPVHIYSSPGNYTVTLTANNENGTSPKTAVISVLQGTSDSSSGSSNSGDNGGSSDSGNDESSHSSHHSSGGSGGGSVGGSPEPQSNVEVKELSQTFVSGGKSAKLVFPRNTTSVVSVSFDSKKTAGKTTAIIEMLKGKSTLVSELPSDEVYKYLNIWVGNSGFATPQNIKNAAVNFKVEKSWIQNNGIDQTSIILNRYNDMKWDQLQTTQSGEDGKYVYFTAQTPAFSFFAITGKAVAKGFVNETESSIPKIGSLEQKNESSAPNVDQTPEQKQSPGTSGNGSTKIPDFELVYGIISLLAVSLFIRK